MVYCIIMELAMGWRELGLVRKLGLLEYYTACWE